MDQERYSIIFSSVTGNTKLLADALRETLPKDACDYFGASENAPRSLTMSASAPAASSASRYAGSTLALLQKLRNKKLFLFGTAGFGISEAYFRKVLDRVRESVDASNTIVGEYMCQGKMPQAVKERYLKMKAQPEHPANLDALIENFDRALPHPDAADLERLKESVLK